MDTEPHKEQLAEVPLLGGRLTPGIVRVGNTVRRSPKGNAVLVHDLLLFLEDQNFPFAPRFLGMDEQGRDILSYLEGETWSDSGSGLSDDLLVQAARAIRLYHDATAGSRLSQGSEIVAHHELGPHNTIFHEGHLVGFIDWDDAAPASQGMLAISHSRMTIMTRWVALPCQSPSQSISWLNCGWS